MKVFVRSALQWLADTRLARRVVETLFRSKARQRVVELDQQSVARCQKKALLGLVQQAHGTRFGRDHNFLRIRNVDDFQRLVPLRTPSELWRDYWQPAFPNLAGASWPGPLEYLAVSAGQQGGQLPCIPVSPQLWASQQSAAMTALAFAMHARPRARLFSGRLLLLESGTVLSSLGPVSSSETLEAVAVRRFPRWLRSSVDSLRQGCNSTASQEHELEQLVERSLSLPVTCLAGTGDRLVRFLDQVSCAARGRRPADLWPDLSAVLHAGPSADCDRAKLVNAIGNPGVLVVEMYCRPEGTIAVEDPRHGRLRLLPDHGVYFEFVPVDQIGKVSPARYSAAQVKVGVPYALAITSPAGVWACLIGSVVRFERLDPPLLRLVKTTMPWEQSVPPAPVKPATPARPLALQPPHPRKLGSAAKLPGRPFRTAWSIRADRE
jgi:hypothetical protein